MSLRWLYVLTLGVAISARVHYKRSEETGPEDALDEAATEAAEMVLLKLVDDGFFEGSAYETAGEANKESRRTPSANFGQLASKPQMSQLKTSATAAAKVAVRGTEMAARQAEALEEPETLRLQPATSRVRVPPQLLPRAHLTQKLDLLAGPAGLPPMYRVLPRVVIGIADEKAREGLKRKLGKAENVEGSSRRSFLNESLPHWKHLHSEGPANSSLAAAADSRGLKELYTRADLVEQHAWKVLSGPASMSSAVLRKVELSSAGSPSEGDGSDATVETTVVEDGSSVGSDEDASPQTNDDAAPRSPVGDGPQAVATEQEKPSASNENASAPVKDEAPCSQSKDAPRTPATKVESPAGSRQHTAASTPNDASRSEGGDAPQIISAEKGRQVIIEEDSSVLTSNDAASSKGVDEPPLEKQRSHPAGISRRREAKTKNRISAFDKAAAAKAIEASSGEVADPKQRPWQASYWLDYTRRRHIMALSRPVARKMYRKTPWSLAMQEGRPVQFKRASKPTRQSSAWHGKKSYPPINVTQDEVALFAAHFEGVEALPV